MAGYELAFTQVQSQIRDGEDALTVYIHWTLILNGYRCIGKGEIPVEKYQQSEILPNGWSQDREMYNLMYVCNKATNQSKDEVYLLKIVRFSGDILVYFMNSRTEEMEEITLTVETYFTGNLISYNSAMKNTVELKKEIEKLFIKKQSVKNSEDKLKEPRNQQPVYDPLRIDRPRHPASGLGGPGWNDPTPNPFNIGRSDLDPFGRVDAGNSGMIFDPFRNGPGRGNVPGLPPGAIPPGARFDPIGPGTGRGGPRFGHGNFAQPDPDHLPPPGYDDMFM